MEPTVSRKCPYCAEEIQVEAIFCKHCGRDLRKQKSKTRRAMLGCLTLLVILTLIGWVSTCNKSNPPAQRTDMGILPEISTFLQHHKEFGNPVGTQAMPDWASGKRQQVNFDSGRNLLFYVKNGAVMTVYEDDGMDPTIYGIDSSEVGRSNERCVRDQTWSESRTAFRTIESSRPSRSTSGARGATGFISDSKGVIWIR